jgi:hypothetical protein
VGWSGVYPVTRTDPTTILNVCTGRGFAREVDRRNSWLRTSVGAQLGRKADIKSWEHELEGATSRASDAVVGWTLRRRNWKRIGFRIETHRICIWRAPFNELITQLA